MGTRKISADQNTKHDPGPDNHRGSGLLRLLLQTGARPDSVEVLRTPDATSGGCTERIVNSRNAAMFYRNASTQNRSHHETGERP